MNKITRIISANFKAVLIISLLVGCESKNSNDITLKEWLVEKEKLEGYAETKRGNCDSLELLLKDLKIEEFRNRASIQLANCYIENGNEERAKDYLLKYLAAGKHISWIDSTKFAAIFPSIRKEYSKLQQEFWKERDTAYFSEIEKRVAIDQASIRTLMNNRTEENRKKELEVHDENAEYLLELSENNGFPWRPGPNNFEKKLFRVGINPTILAIHAQVKDKIRIRDYAMESARKGRNSWNIPIGLGVTFYTQLPRNEVKPIRFLHFDKNNGLLMEASYLQLYSIKRFMQDNNLANIKMQPSKASSLNQETVEAQLEEIKNALVSEFDFDVAAIELSETPDVNENHKVHQEEGSYSFTFSTF